MTAVLEARREYEQARNDAKAHVDRARARLGLAIHRARESGTSQTKILESMRLSREQVRAFERAYREWLRDHTEAELD